MKKYILLFLLIFSSFNLAYSNNFEIFPIVFNLHTVKTLGNNVVAFGSLGYAMLSNDDGENWEQIKVNNSGLIVNIFGTNNILISFGNKGDICITNLTDSTTITEKKLNDSILAVIQYPDGYFVRAANRIFTLNNNFEIVYSSELVSSDLSESIAGQFTNFNRSIAYFKEHFIVELDSAYFVRYDKHLNIIDTLSVLGMGLVTKTINSNVMDTDDNYLYFRVTTNNNSFLESYIYRTENFIDIEEFQKLLSGRDIFHIYDNNLVVLPTNDPSLKDTNYLAMFSSIYIKDFTIKNNKQIIVGNSKLIEIFNMQDSTLQLKSNAIGYSLKMESLILPNNEILLFGSDVPYFWKSTDGGITFMPTVDKQAPNYDPLLPLCDFNVKYYDTLNKKIYFVGHNDYGRERIFESDDFCKTFTSRECYVYTKPAFSLVMLLNALDRPKANITDDYVYIPSGGIITIKDLSKVCNYIQRLDKDLLKVQDFIIDSTAGQIDYVYSLDTNSFIVHSANILDSTSEIKYTTDKTITWETIHKYEKNQIQSFNTEIWSRGKRYLALVHIEKNTTNNEITAVYLDALDLASKEFHRIKEWYPDDYSRERDFGLFGVGLVSDDNYVYVSFQDTLFYVKDILAENSWAYHNLPSDRAKIVMPLVKYGDEIISRYVDENIPWGGGANLFRIKPLDPISTSVESEIETMNYLFSYPPYPMPATNEVRSLIYWYTSIDIDEKNIVVYNIYGEKVSTEEQIKIDRLTGYSGNLIWDCSGVPAGVYLINIKHGTQNQTIKAIVTK